MFCANLEWFYSLDKGYQSHLTFADWGWPMKSREKLKNWTNQQLDDISWIEYIALTKLSAYGPTLPGRAIHPFGWIIQDWQSYIAALI